MHATGYTVLLAQSGNGQHLPRLASNFDNDDFFLFFFFSSLELLLFFHRTR